MGEGRRRLHPLAHLERPPQPTEAALTSQLLYLPLWAPPALERVGTFACHLKPWSLICLDKGGLGRGSLWAWTQHGDPSRGALKTLSACLPRSSENIHKARHPLPKMPHGPEAAEWEEQVPAVR